jgi:glycosyltransferase involved in cell wall biosynthesis
VGERTIALVPPRYGTDVVGGSESVMREAAVGLAARGWDVEVLTTCARSHYTWANEYPEGSEQVDGLTLHRFPTVRPEVSRDRELLERRIQVGLPLRPDEELTWVNELFRVPALYHHLLAEHRRYRAIVLSPYLFWTTAVGATVDPARTIVMPCLHDEPYARLGLFRSVVGGAARAWFLSDPERDLAVRLGLAPADHDVTGAGVDVPTAYDAEGFRARHGISRPFVLYAGRREGGKGWDDLLGAYAEAVTAHGLGLDLVTMGVGPVLVPPGLEGRVHDLGFLDAAEAPDAFAAAAAYAQPSRNESFSRTIMEAWLAGTFVLANAESDVVAWHCERSGAGIVWHDRDELVAGLELVDQAPGTTASLAAGGRPYVLEHYTWPTVLDAMERSLEAMPCAG